VIRTFGGPRDHFTPDVNCLGTGFVDCLLDDAGIGDFRVADDPGFVDVNLSSRIPPRFPGLFSDFLYCAAYLFQRFEDFDNRIVLILRILSPQDVKFRAGYGHSQPPLIHQGSDLATTPHSSALSALESPRPEAQASSKSLAKGRGEAPAY
jgi:hypothetical protein